ncbi:TPA: hypothetical protein ACQ3WD_002202 [Clostridium perfringens]
MSYCENCKYKEYSIELKKENEELIRALDVVKKEGDDIKEHIQKFILDYAKERAN